MRGIGSESGPSSSQRFVSLVIDLLESLVCQPEGIETTLPQSFIDRELGHNQLKHIIRSLVVDSWEKIILRLTFQGLVMRYLEMILNKMPLLVHCAYETLHACEWRERPQVRPRFLCVDSH